MPDHWHIEVCRGRVGRPSRVLWRGHQRGTRYRRPPPSGEYIVPRRAGDYIALEGRAASW